MIESFLQEQMLTLDQNVWNYQTGMFLNAVLKYHQLTRKTIYLDYVISYYNDIIDEHGKINVINFDYNDLANYYSLINIFDVYSYTKEKKYLNLIHHSMSQLLKQPQTLDGVFWVKRHYKDQVWLESLFYSLNFYLKYQIFDNNFRKIKDVKFLIEKVLLKLYNHKQNIYIHSFDEKTKDLSIHNTPVISWSKSVGLYGLTLIDLFEDVPETCVVEKDYLKKQINEYLLNAKKHLDKDTRMLKQVLNREDNDNFFETTGSLCLSYVILKSYRLKIINETSLTLGLDILEGINNRYHKNINDKHTIGGMSSDIDPNNHSVQDIIDVYLIKKPIINELSGLAVYFLNYYEMHLLLNLKQ